MLRKRQSNTFLLGQPLRTFLIDFTLGLMLLKHPIHNAGIFILSGKNYIVQSL